MKNTVSDQKAAQFFDGFAIDFDTLYDGQRGPVMRWLDDNFRSDIYLRFMKTFESLGDLTHKTVLDIGCGSGPYLKEALERNVQKITGLDPAPGMLTICERRLNQTEYQGRFELVEGLFPETKINNHDFAIVMGVMDYVEDKSNFINRLSEVVNEKAVVSFPSRHWFRSPVRKIRYNLRNCPLWFYDEEAIRKYGKDSKFRQTNIDKVKGAGQDYVVTFVK